MGETVKESPKDLLTELALQQPEIKIEDSPVASFGRGVARGALGPLLDLYYRAVGKENIVKEEDALSPVAEGAGHLTGLVGGALLAGPAVEATTAAKLGQAATKASTLSKVASYATPGGLASRLGAATKVAGTKGLGAAADTLGGRLALGSLAAGAEGATVGLSEGSSAAALDREAGIPGVARHVAEGVGYGMAMGGSLGLLGTAFYRANNWLFKKSYNDAIKTAGKAMKDRLESNLKLDAYADELKSLQKTIDEDSSFVQRAMGGPAAKAQSRMDEILGTAGSARKDSIRGYNPSEGSELLAEQLKVEHANEIIHNLTSRTAGAMGKEARDVARSLIFAAPGLVAGGAPGVMGSLIFRKFMPEYFVSIADHIIGGIEKFPALRQVLGRSIQGGELTVDKFHKFGNEIRRIPAGYFIDQATGELQRSPFKLSNIDSYVLELRNAGRSIKTAPLHYMTSDDYNDIVNEFQNTDLGQYEWNQRLSLMQSGLPQEVINGHIEHQLRVQQYIKSTLPSVRGDQFITSTGDRLQATDAERIALSRRLRAAMLPETVINDFLHNKLTPEAAEAFYVTQPYAARELSEEVTRLAEISRAFGTRLSPTQMRQIALITNNPTKAGRTYDYNLVQMLQANYAPKQQAAPQMASPPKLDGVSHQSMSAADVLAARLAGPQ